MSTNDLFGPEQTTEQVTSCLGAPVPSTLEAGDQGPYDEK